MLSYEQTMSMGTERYRDVLEHLSDAGFGATFTQTGGMNAALEVLLDGGHALLITDGEEPLSWDRADHRGWGAGLYPPANTDGECLAFDSTDDGSLAALMPLLNQVLDSYVHCRHDGR